MAVLISRDVTKLNWTELNWHALASDELTMAVYITVGTVWRRLWLRDYAHVVCGSTNDQWTRSARLLFSSSETKPCQFSSVQLRRFVRALISVQNFIPLKCDNW